MTVASPTSKASSIRQDFIPILAAIVIVNIMFWMDEGYYDFRWMRSLGNWIMFIVYTGGLVLGELLVSHVISEKITGNKRLSLIIVLGTPLGIALVIISMIAIGRMVRFIM